MEKKIKKIVLISPNTTIDKECIKRLVSPFGLLYIAAVLEKEGYEVSLIDSPCEGYENVIEDGDYVTYGLNYNQIREKIERENPDAVGIACFFSYNENKVYQLCKLVKSVNGGIITITGGIHPSYYPKEMLEKCKELDLVIMKEGEYRLLKFLNALNAGESYEQQEGIAFRKGGEVVVNPATSYITNLDEIPFPARHLQDMEKYIKVGKFTNPFSRKKRVGRVLTTRGCPYNCCFCAGSQFCGNIRFRSVENVIQEMRFLKEKYDIEEIQFLDDNLTVNKKRVMELFRRMKEEFDFVWCTPGGVMMKLLDEEMLKAMAECGCYQLTFSPETGSQRVLNEIIHKPFNLNAVKPLVDIAHKYDIDIHANFIVGLPGETREELMQTFDFAKEAGFDSTTFFIAVPCAGTELYEICKSRGWLREDNSTADYKHANIMIGKHEKEYVMSPEEMQELVDRKTKEFNEWNQKRNPDRWKRKFGLFVQEHNKEDEVDKIMGRVV